MVFKIFRKLLLIFHGNGFCMLKWRVIWLIVDKLNLCQQQCHQYRKSGHLIGWQNRIYIRFVQNGTVLEHWKHLSPARIRASGVFGFVFDLTTNRIYCHRVSKHHLSLVTWKYAQSTYLDVPKPIEGKPITLQS